MADCEPNHCNWDAVGMDFDAEYRDQYHENVVEMDWNVEYHGRHLVVDHERLVDDREQFGCPDYIYLCQVVDQAGDQAG